MSCMSSSDTETSGEDAAQTTGEAAAAAWSGGDLNELFGNNETNSDDTTSSADSSGLDNLFGTTEDAAADEADHGDYNPHTEQYNERIEQLHEYYPTVQRMLGMISGSAGIQQQLKHFEITRDPEIDAEQRHRLRDAVEGPLLEAEIRMPSEAAGRVIWDLLYDEYTGLSVLGEVWRDDDITEICVDAWNSVTVERNGNLEKTGITFVNAEHANSVTRALSQHMSDRQVSPANPIVTAQLPGARVQFIWGALSADGLAIAIRKFRDLLGMASLLGYGSLTQDMVDFLRDAVHARATILVSGGTGTGKTTMINALSEAIPPEERVITIEDAFELQLSNNHVLSLQSKTKSSSDDPLEITQEDLLIASLRMRPDRIIVGEIREPKAAAVMLAAANTGHDGTMTTIHANSSHSALNSRMVGLVARADGGFSETVARNEVGQALNLVVQISRRHGRRYVSEISVVDPSTVTKTEIRSETLFVGEIGAGQTVNFRQVGAVRADTHLGIKLDAVGLGKRWTRT